MPPLAGHFNLTDDPSVDLRIAENIGNSMGQVVSAFKLKQEKLRKQTANTEFIRVLNKARQAGLSPEETLSEIYKVPDYAESVLAQDYAQKMEIFNQNRLMLGERNRSDQEVAQLRADNQYNMLLARLEGSQLSEEQKQAGRMELNQARQDGRLDEIAYRSGYQSDLQGQKAVDQSLLQYQRDQAASERQDKSIAAAQAKPKYFRGQDGLMYEYRPAQMPMPEVSNYPKQAIDFTNQAFKGVGNVMVNEFVQSAQPPKATPIQGMPAKPQADLQAKRTKEQIAFWQRERSDAFLNDDTARYDEADGYIRKLEKGYVPQDTAAAPVGTGQPSTQTQQAAPGTTQQTAAQSQQPAAVPPQAGQPSTEEIIIAGQDGKPALRATKPPQGQVLIEKDGQYFFIPESQADDAMAQGYGVYR